VFHDHDLPLGRFRVRGQLVEPAAIERTALMTVEGEKDDICAVGQTVAAHDLCIGIPPAKKTQHLQPQVGLPEGQGLHLRAGLASDLVPPLVGSSRAVALRWLPPRPLLRIRLGPP
jgi:hypothetical protein